MGDNVKKAGLSNSNDSFGSCRTYGPTGNFCGHCGKKLMEPSCGVVPKFCVYCGQPTQMTTSSPWPPNGFFENQVHSSVPNVGYGNLLQMQSMMSMPMMQTPVQNSPSTGQSQGLPVMMRMPDNVMMSMCMPVGVPFQQGLQ